MGGLCAGEGALLSPLSLTLTLPLRDEQGNLHKISSREKKKKRESSLVSPRGKVRPKKGGGWPRAGKGRRSRRRLSG